MFHRLAELGLWPGVRGRILPGGGRCFDRSPRGFANASVEATGQLRDFRLKALQQIPADVIRPAVLRKVSLRGLEAAIAQTIDHHQPLPDVMKYLAGLQQIQFVLVYPEQHDIVLVGPAEGWKVDAAGNLVGATNGRPVMLLDDLLVALRSAQQAAQSGISCSIDPTQEGLARVAALRQMGPGRDPHEVANEIGQALGTPENQHSRGAAHDAFCPGVGGRRLSHETVGNGFRAGAAAAACPATCRCCPAPSGTCYRRAGGWSPITGRCCGVPIGLAWELGGAAVKTMTEEEFVGASGSRQRSGKADPLAQKWADNMTAHYDELAVAVPIFGQLRNCMDLAIVAALITKENLPQAAGCSLPLLMDSSRVEVDQFAAPRQVDTQMNLLKKGSHWLMSASGGVQINSFGALRETPSSDAPAAVRAKTTPPATGSWWWN